MYPNIYIYILVTRIVKRPVAPGCHSCQAISPTLQSSRLFPTLHALGVNFTRINGELWVGTGDSDAGRLKRGSTRDGIRNRNKI